MTKIDLLCTLNHKIWPSRSQDMAMTVLTSTRKNSHFSVVTVTTNPVVGQVLDMSEHTNGSSLCILICENPSLRRCFMAKTAEKRVSGHFH